MQESTKRIPTTTSWQAQNGVNARERFFILCPMARRTRLLACAALLSTLFLTFHLLRDATRSFDQSHHPYDYGTSPTKSVQVHLPVPAPSPKSEWCQYNDCLKGKWVPRNPSFKNLAEFQEAYKNSQEPIWSRAPIPSPSISGLEFTDEESAVLETQRFLDLMNYVWLPNDGMGKMKNWDPEEFVVQMLRTPGGLIMIGGQSASFFPAGMRELITEGRFDIAAAFSCVGLFSSRR